MKNILFLQGPVGFFFANFQKKLEKLGYNTFSIGFNYADWVFSYKKKFTLFKQNFYQWRFFLKNYLIENKIDRIYLFGDGRIYHRVAKKLAKQLKIEVYVFEEGYIRPNFITCEKNGVNGFSSVPLNKSFYDELPEVESYPETKPIPYVFNITATVAIIYYLILGSTSFLLPVIHHRNSNLIIEFIYGTKNLYRKIYFMFSEKKLFKKIISQDKLSKRYFLAVLQTDNDFQLKLHSDIKSNKKFIEKIVDSFSQNRTQDQYLIFKHHPLDRGRKNYDKFINNLAQKYNLEKYILSSHDLHLPTMIDNSIGVITINSTVGLSGLRHKKPVATLGRAVYNIEHLVSHINQIDDFWNNYKNPDEVLLKKYLNYLLENTQIEGSFYKKFPKKLMQKFKNNL
jgi:capsular polysaccharide export protein